MSSFEGVVRSFVLSKFSSFGTFRGQPIINSNGSKAGTTSARGGEGGVQRTTLDTWRERNSSGWKRCISSLVFPKTGA